VPEAAGYPDAPFIEDTAVIVGDRVLLTRPGHASRRGEVGGVRRALADVVETSSIAQPATLDGGDVLQVGDRIFVGRSSRTNDGGIAALAAFARGRRVIPVEVTGVLHLKSAVTALDDETLLVFPDGVDTGHFEGYRVVSVGADDPEVANIVKLPDGRILVGSPASAAIVTDLGFEPLVVDVSEFGRAGGGLTCLSLRFRDVFAARTP
jgi:dimethylargininase